MADNFATDINSSINRKVLGLQDGGATCRRLHLGGPRRNPGHLRRGWMQPAREGRAESWVAT